MAEKDSCSTRYCESCKSPQELLGDIEADDSSVPLTPLSNTETVKKEINLLLTRFLEAIERVRERRGPTFSLTIDGFELRYGGPEMTFFEDSNVPIDGLDVKALTPDFSIGSCDTITMFSLQGKAIEKRTLDLSAFPYQVAYSTIGADKIGILSQLVGVVEEPHLAKKEDLIELQKVEPKRSAYFTSWPAKAASKV